MRANRDEIILFLTQMKQDLLSKGIVNIGLFGSFARDEPSVYSDIDIVIEKEKDYLQKRSAYEYFEQVTQIKLLIKKQFSRNSDVFDIDSSSTMKTSILKELIYV